MTWPLRLWLNIGTFLALKVLLLVCIFTFMFQNAPQKSQKTSGKEEEERTTSWAWVWWLYIWYRSRGWWGRDPLWWRCWGRQYQTIKKCCPCQIPSDFGDSASQKQDGKKVKVTAWKSSYKHCPKVFEHKKHWGLKRHLMTKHLTGHLSSALGPLLRCHEEA